MKIALFQSIKFPEVQPNVGYEDGWQTRSAEYTRVSEWIDPEFPPRAPDAIITEQLQTLDVMEREVEKDYAVKIEAIKQRRAELAALTYTPRHFTDSIDIEQVMQ